MEKHDYINYAEKLKALGHPVRLKIAIGLSNNSHTVNQLCNYMGIPQATVSQHLATLRNKGIIEGSRNGTSINYYLSNEKVRNILNDLESQNTSLQRKEVGKVMQKEARG